MRELGAGVDSLARQTLVPATATCEPTGTIHSAEPLSLGVFLLVGLLGGAHCLGMCGPLVSTYADRMRSDAADGNGGNGGPERDRTSRRKRRSHRATGAPTRAVQPRTNGELRRDRRAVRPRGEPRVRHRPDGDDGRRRRPRAHGIGRRCGRHRDRRAVRPPTGAPAYSGSRDRSRLGVVTGRIVPEFDAWVGNWRIVGLGAAHGLLPCPLLYPAFLYAFVQGSALGGAAALAALGLGTVPALFLFGTVFGSVSVDTRMRLHRALGVAFVALGYIPLQHGLATLGVPLPHPPIPYYSPL